KPAGLSIPVRVSALLAGLLCLLAVPALISPPGAAANYTVIECVPNSVPAPDAVAVQNGSPKIFQDAECVGGQRSGWGLSLEANGLSNRGESRAWAFYAPPGTSFASASALVHQQPGHGYGALYSEDGGTLGFNNEWSTVAVTNTSFFGVSLQCFAASCQSPGGAGNTSLDAGWAFITHFQGDVFDAHRPAVAAAGPLFRGEVVRGQQEIDVSATDFGGGVRAVAVFVNDVASTSQTFCAPDPSLGAYTNLKPCPGSADAQLNLSTERDPGWVNGPNEVSVCAVDVAGNSSGCINRTVQTDNSCPASGGQAAEQLESGLDSSGRLEKAAHGRSLDIPVVRGVLRTGTGGPVQGATVCFYETVALQDGSRQLSSIATTQQNGRFATSLDPGPSRQIDVVYRYNDEALTERLVFESSVVPRFKILERSLDAGHAAHFRGELPGPGANSRVVALQARAGRKWRTFKQLRTDALGVFRGKYPFKQTVGHVVYRFRAVVKRQGEYPYEPGRSKTRRLLVRG
ncbi:MAG: hypothetical protein ACXWGS_12650, partial [Solirubrobacterales bacterium]